MIINRDLTVEAEEGVGSLWTIWNVNMKERIFKVRFRIVETSAGG